MEPDRVLDKCLHGGPVPYDSLSEVHPTSFLSTCMRHYGSAAILAIEDNQVIGQLRFYPKEVAEMMDERVCIEHRGTQLHFEKSNKLPTFDELEEKHLKIDCMQLVTGYYAADGLDFGNRGIGKQLLEEFISWARKNQWKKISYKGIEKAGPLINWTGLYPRDNLISLGFEVETSYISEPLKEGISNQMKGYHGKEIKEGWAHYSAKEIDELSTVTDLSISL